MLDLMRAIAPRGWLSRAPVPALPDPLDEARELVSIRAALEIGGKLIDCTIVELTARSASICLDALDPAHGAFIGQQGLLRPLGGRPISTVVRWFTDRTLSLKFMTAASLGAFSASIDRFREGRQRPGRAEVAINAQIMVGPRALKGTILNLSGGGALIRTGGTVRPGELVMLQSELLRPIGGYVRWRNDRLLGVMFNRLLSLDCAEIVSQAFNIHPIWLEEIPECHRD